MSGDGEVRGRSGDAAAETLAAGPGSPWPPNGDGSTPVPAATATPPIMHPASAAAIPNRTGRPQRTGRASGLARRTLPTSEPAYPSIAAFAFASFPWPTGPWSEETGARAPRRLAWRAFGVAVPGSSAPDSRALRNAANAAASPVSSPPSTRVTASASSVSARRAALARVAASTASRGSPRSRRSAASRSSHLLCSSAITCPSASASANASHRRTSPRARAVLSGAVRRRACRRGPRAPSAHANPRHRATRRGA